jgi:hypothetical protein
LVGTSPKDFGDELTALVETCTPNGVTRVDDPMGMAIVMLIECLIARNVISRQEAIVFIHLAKQNRAANTPRNQITCAGQVLELLQMQEPTDVKAQSSKLVSSEGAVTSTII